MKIEVNNLVKTYVQGDEKIKALNNVGFTISSGEFIAITGRSGSGKSTLLNIMAGLTVPTSGSVIFDGKNLFSLSDKRLSALRNSKIGCVPQVSSLLSSMNVLDNIRLPFHLSGRKGSDSKAYELLAMVGLEKMASRMPKRLSGGQLKRVVIARAIMNEPSLLLVDEPTGDLDDQTAHDMMVIFKKLSREGTAVLMVTHDLNTLRHTDRCFKMSKGVLAAEG
jgi:putative ABC transport system ATP-binding protein